ncbi:hypothetical protein HAV15_013210 [Penicillium sp. str. |nr:hypothetical protein HAV15_013210 [Penicillium sp. str. \
MLYNGMLMEYANQTQHYAICKVLQNIIGQTKAGITLAGDLYARQAHKRELQSLKSKLTAEISHRNSEHAALIRELKADLEKQMKKSEQDKRALEKSMADLHDEEERAWRKRMKILEYMFQADLAKLHDVEESLAEIRKDTARRTKRSQQVTLQLQRYEKDVENVRGEVTEARELHQKVSGKRNLFDGAANGIASGIAIGVISASTLYHLRRLGFQAVSSCSGAVLDILEM